MPAIIGHPIDNIRICTLGCVSAGKTTVLEALFLSQEKLSQTGMKRTTMIPTIFVESDEKPSSAILKEITRKNKEVVEKTERGEALTIADCSQEPIYQVGHLNMAPDVVIATPASNKWKIPFSASASEPKQIITGNPIQSFKFTVYDIPGLNDARTKSVYYQYIDNMFSEFNMVMFIVDINSGLNTSDEMDILNLIIQKTIDARDKHGKIIKTMVIVNKVDDMQMSDTDQKPEITGEYKTMFDQVVKTVHGEFKKADIYSHIAGIIPICANDSYLYRMVDKYGNGFTLTEEQILNIGTNEQGKRFSRKTKAEQRAEVDLIMKNKVFVGEMIELSGFQLVKDKFNELFQEIGVDMKQQNIEHEFSKFKPVNALIEDGLVIGPVVNQFDIWRTFKRVMTIETFKPRFQAEYDKIMKVIASKIDKFKDISTLVREFAKFRDSFNATGAGIINIDANPECYVSRCIALILENINKHKTLKSFVDAIETLKTIDQFTIEPVTIIINRYIEVIEVLLVLYTKGVKSNYASEIIDVDQVAVVNIIESLIDVKFDTYKLIHVIRGILMCNASTATNNQLMRQAMYYDKIGEIPMKHFLLSITTGNIVQPAVFMYYDGEYAQTWIDKLYLKLLPKN